MRDGDRRQGDRVLPVRHGDDRSRPEGRPPQASPPTVAVARRGSRAGPPRGVPPDGGGYSRAPEGNDRGSSRSRRGGSGRPHGWPRAAALRYTPGMPEARLEVTDALGRRVVPIVKAPFEIGRRETNDLRLAGSEVSRDHAEIVSAGDGFLLRDRSSRYGTYVNGDQVTERALAHGDRIRLGRSGGAEMVFLIADSEPIAER